MIENNKIRWAIVLFSLLLASAWMAPNFYAFKEKQWWVSKEKLVYGLDIQGGLHLVMGVKTDEAIQEKVQSLIGDLKEALEKSKVEVTNIKVLKEKTGQVELSLEKPEDREKAKEVLEKEYPLMGSVRLRILKGSDEGVLTLGYNEVELIRLRKEIANQVVEVIRRRIDEFGVSEPIITIQGDDRVLVQLPGIQNSARARDIIQRTAKLEFRLVNQEIQTPQLFEWVKEAEEKNGYTLSLQLPYSEYVRKINEDLKDKIPENHLLVFQRAESSNSLLAGKIPVLVRTDSGVGGDILQTAFVSPDEFGNPQVSFNINVAGRKTFSELTGNNIKKPLAIILDKELKSMPIIQSRISDRGSISMGRSNDQNIQEEAENISTVLRAGALPARLVKMEERTVGPTLGRDSIEKGKKAGILAGILVIIFMLLYYKTLGLVANAALCMNVLCLLALLTSLGATLTLPGVAGIILTIGMAVDANVIIYERLKEELKKGSSIVLAVRDGYKYALSAILDANITTAIVCVVLMSFGTGPIRGFAVTLFCGIITSIFTAVFVSRTVLNTLIRKFQLKRL